LALQGRRLIVGKLDASIIEDLFFSAFSWCCEQFVDYLNLHQTCVETDGAGIPACIERR
jgi:hypothetical protein